MTRDQYRVLLEEQEWRCAICRTDQAGPTVSHSLCVDHDHATGHIRGLLCHDCNVAIGRLKDNPELCRAAATYLESHQAQAVA
jgi:hypothetical protein